MHAERARSSAETAEALNEVKAGAGKIVAVGTTSLRLLESAAGDDGRLRPFGGETSLFITPGYRFRFVDRLLTNFHLPRSTLFMLVASFSGLDLMKRAYAHAVAERYRFYSYGDACLLSPAGSAAMTAIVSPSTRESARRQGARRRHRHAARGRAHAGLHAGRHRRHGQGHVPRGRRGGRRRHHPRQHLSSDAAARRRAHRQARRACTNSCIGTKPILTDSGGYQVMSLAKLRRIDEEGVTFQSHIDGATVELTPERAIEVQCLLGADIQMVLDECTPFPATRDEAKTSLELSLRWAERCKAAFATSRASRARPCSASCRAASIPICASEAPAR